MKLILSLFLMSSIFLSANQIEKQPETIEEFVQLRDEMATTPEGGATMFLLAMKIFAEDEKLGSQCLTVTINIERLEKNPKGYKGYSLSNPDRSFFLSRKEVVPYLANSYFEGSSPENGYNVSLPYIVTTERAKSYGGSEEEGKIKIFVHCSGADSARPITLTRNSKGLWKAHEWSSLLVGVRPPKKEDDGDDL